MKKITKNDLIILILLFSIAFILLFSTFLYHLILVVSNCGPPQIEAGRSKYENCVINLVRTENVDLCRWVSINKGSCLSQLH